MFESANRLTYVILTRRAFTCIPAFPLLSSHEDKYYLAIDYIAHIYESVHVTIRFILWYILIRVKLLNTYP